MAVFIDTQLWVYAKKYPIRKDFQDQTGFDNAEQRFELSFGFLRDQVKTGTIAMTYHQLSEIYHALGFHGRKLPHDHVFAYCTQLLRAEFMNWFACPQDILEEALRESRASGIHVWDYLCILPLIKDVTVLYTCDAHFQHESFKKYGVPIENPIQRWETL